METVTLSMSMLIARIRQFDLSKITNGLSYLVLQMAVKSIYLELVSYQVLQSTIIVS